MSEKLIANNTLDVSAAWKIGLHVTLGTIIAGLNIGSYNSTAPSIESVLEMNTFEKDWIMPIFNALMPVGAMFGALISGPYSTKYGRRKTLMIANLITIFSCALYLPPYIPVFLIARFVSGLSVGIYGVLCPVIIFETIPLELSGKIGGLIQLNINLGIAVAYALSLSLPTGDYSSDKRSYLYILVYCFQGVFAIFQLVLFLMKYKLETPGWLLEKQRPEEALISLRQMYNEKGAEAALDNLVKSLREAKEQKASADEDITYADLLFFRKGQAKSFRIGLMLNLVQQWCGINAILGYSTNIFKKQANASGILAMGLTLVIGVVNLIWAMMLVPVIGKYGRKPLLWIGALGMAVCLTIIGICDGIDLENIYLSLFVIITYLLFFQFSSGPVTWIVCGEILAAKAMSICLGLNWFCAAAVVFLYPIMDKNLKHGGVFFFYSGICVFGAVYLWLDLIETKGKTRQELKVILSKKE